MSSSSCSLRFLRLLLLLGMTIGTAMSTTSQARLLDEDLTAQSFLRTLDQLHPSAWREELNRISRAVVDEELAKARGFLDEPTALPDLKLGGNHHGISRRSDDQDVFLATEERFKQIQLPSQSSSTNSWTPTAAYASNSMLARPGNVGSWVGVDFSSFLQRPWQGPSTPVPDLLFVPLPPHAVPTHTLPAAKEDQQTA